MSDEQASDQTGTQAHSPPDGYATWNGYWTKEHSQPWRTEPEIVVPRRQFLRRKRAIEPVIEKSIYPFRGIKLDRADIEWLLETLESGGMIGPVDWSDPKQWQRQGIDLTYANLAGVDLRRLPLAKAKLFAASLEQSDLRVADLRGANLTDAILRNADLGDANLEGALLVDADLRGAIFAPGDNLRWANLWGVHAEGVDFSNAHLEQATLDYGHFEGCFFYGENGGAYMQGATLVKTHLEGAELLGAQLQGAILWESHLEGANLQEVHLEGADLRSAFLGGILCPAEDLERIRQESPKFPEALEPANLRGAYCDPTTVLKGINLGSIEQGFATVADVSWNGANLAVVKWVQETLHQGRKQLKPIVLGDDGAALQSHDKKGTLKGKSTRLDEFETAVRANRQLATALRSQGLNEDSDRFSYRAQVLQRRVLQYRGQWLRYLGSMLLDLIAGYGYKPLRSFITYLFVVAGFAVGYYLLRDSVIPQLSALDSVVFSLTSFHGRGFMPGENVNLHNPLTILAAVEAIIGLLIEITFIATFTQRFFAR